MPLKNEKKLKEAIHIEKSEKCISQMGVNHYLKKTKKVKWNSMKRSENNSDSVYEKGIILMVALCPKDRLELESFSLKGAYHIWRKPKKILVETSCE